MPCRSRLRRRTRRTRPPPPTVPRVVDAETPRPSATPEKEGGPAVSTASRSPGRPRPHRIDRPFLFLQGLPQAPSPLIFGDPRIARSLPCAGRSPGGPDEASGLNPGPDRGPNVVPPAGPISLSASPNVLGADAGRPVVVSTTIAAPTVVPDASPVPRRRFAPDAVRDVLPFPTTDGRSDGRFADRADRPRRRFLRRRRKASPEASAVAATDPRAPVLTELSAPRPEFSSDRAHAGDSAGFVPEPLSIGATRKPGIDGETPAEIQDPSPDQPTRGDRRTHGPSEPATRTETTRAAEPTGKSAARPIPATPRSPGPRRSASSSAVRRPKESSSIVAARDRVRPTLRRGSAVRRRPSRRRS